MGEGVETRGWIPPQRRSPRRVGRGKSSREGVGPQGDLIEEEVEVVVSSPLGLEADMTVRSKKN